MPAFWKAALAAPLLLSATEPLDMRTINDGPPPARYMSSATVQVAFGGVKECGTPPEGYTFEGCQRGDTIYVPNPCDHMKEGKFAVILCHELGHRNGWNRTHDN